MEDKDFNFKMIYLNQTLLQVFKDGRIRKKVGLLLLGVRQTEIIEKY